MRIRSIKPEFWKSEDMAALPWDARLLFIGLWSYVDDNGVGRDVDKLIAADIFPLEDDPRDTLATVSRGLQQLFQASHITRYTVDGRPFLHVATWDKHQKIDRPAKPRYPLPTCGNAVIRDTLATPSRQSRETFATGTGEQGIRGTGEKEGGGAVRTQPSPARDEDRETPQRPVVPVDGWKHVRELIPDQHPQAVRTGLAQQAGTLLKAGTPEPDVRAALELWLAKPNLGPSVLPSLVSEVIRGRSPTNGKTATAKAMGWLATGQALIDAYPDEPTAPKELTP